MFSFKAFRRSVRLWSWAPDPGVRRHHEDLPGGATRVVLEYGSLRASVVIGPEETEWPFVFAVLDAMCEGLINGAYAAILREQARLRRVPGMFEGVPQDVKLEELDDIGLIFDKKLFAIARENGIGTRRESAECSGK